MFPRPVEKREFLHMLMEVKLLWGKGLRFWKGLHRRGLHRGLLGIWLRNRGASGQL